MHSAGAGEVVAAHLQALAPAEFDKALEWLHEVRLSHHQEVVALAHHRHEAESKLASDTAELGADVDA